MNELILNIEKWGDDKGITKQENSFKQLAKCMEELGETAGALCKNQPEKLKDGIGDTVVTLILLARQNGLTLQECVEAAWDEIKDRTGANVNGMFIKD